MFILSRCFSDTRARTPDLRLRSVKVYGTNTIIADAAPLLAGSGLGVMRPSTPRIRAKSGNRKLGEKCEHCNKADDKDNIVVCESCDLGFHKYCLDPAMASLPDYDWHCPKCLVGTGEYGFEEGGIYSLKVFQEKANNFKQHYFSSRMP